VLFYGLIGISVTTICRLWLGQYQATFIQFALLLNIGWFVNTLIGPAYFSNLGSGKLRANVISDAIMGLCSPFLAAVLGYSFGGVGVVVGTILGLITGSIFLLISHIKQSDLSWTTFILPKDMVNLLGVAVLVVILSNYGRDQQSSFLIVIGSAVLSSIPLLLLSWFNPLRVSLLQR